MSEAIETEQPTCWATTRNGSVLDLMWAALSSSMIALAFLRPCEMAARHNALEACTGDKGTKTR